jgi:NAD(P)-dependent dehydrogenase (short-subunit alcohol dehydrogenase family)
MIVTARNQTAAVIGAGDFIAAAIAKKLAAEGFTLFVGRRNGDKLAPLVNVQRRLPRTIGGLDYEYSAQHLHA